MNKFNKKVERKIMEDAAETRNTIGRKCFSR